LCVLKCAFWQSFPQYATLWHFRHCFNVSGDFEHCAHVDVDVEFDDEDASVVVLELATLSVGIPVESAMVE
jgi:hypothetical protein